MQKVSREDVEEVFHVFNLKGLILKLGSFNHEHKIYITHLYKKTNSNVLTVNNSAWKPEIYINYSKST